MAFMIPSMAQCFTRRNLLQNTYSCTYTEVQMKVSGLESQAINLAVIKLLISVKRLEAPKWFQLAYRITVRFMVRDVHRGHVKKVYSKTKTRGTGLAELM